MARVFAHDDGEQQMDYYDIGGSRNVIAYTIICQLHTDIEIVVRLDLIRISGA